jgi:hypothetical protein
MSLILSLFREFVASSSSIASSSVGDGGECLDLSVLKAGSKAIT